MAADDIKTIKRFNYTNCELSDDQKEAFDCYKNGENIFITGPGGCGKSYLVKKIYNDALECGKKIKVTALTGCASILLNCNATTLHSWSGIGLAKSDQDKIITNIKMNRYKASNWKKTDVLVIDEVSMMSKSLFELLDQVGKQVRKNAKPFGGIQLIFCGDFYQLPPVGNDYDPESGMFCFESLLWGETFDSQIIMDKIFRQKDQIYACILNQIREGKLLRPGYKALMDRVGKSSENSEIKPVKLFPVKRLVEKVNNDEMEKLQTPVIEFKCKTQFEIPETDKQNPKYKKPSKKQMEIEEKFIKNNSLFENDLKLKIGAQVMLICNLDMERGLCNGSTGIIVGFDNFCPMVKFNNGILETVGKHAWASDSVVGLSVLQVPLILAWAVTIHKSQGATLDVAEIDIGSNVFACGQTYVALSRVKDLNGLYLKSFSPTKIKVSKKVKEFYEQFYCYESD